MLLQHGANLGKVNHLEIINPEYAVGIAHIHHRGRMNKRACRWGRPAVQYGACRGKGSDKGMSFQPKRGTPLSIVTTLSPAFRTTRNPAQRINGGRRRLVLVKQHVGNAARSIATAFNLPAAAVPHQHAHVSDIGFLQDDDLVATDACLAVGNGPGPARSSMENGARPLVEHDKIIAEPVHLAKRKCACLGHFGGYMVKRAKKASRNSCPFPLVRRG